MKPGMACCCLLGVLSCWTQGYPETIHRYTDKNGVLCFSNSLTEGNFPNRGLSENQKPASAELQRAREQAEIEYWRAVEAKARSLRNTPDTEVHRKGRPSSQLEDFSLRKGPSGKKTHRRKTGKMRGSVSNDRKPVPDSAESKKVRSRKTKLQAWKNAPEWEFQSMNRSYFPRRNAALK